MRLLSIVSNQNFRKTQCPTFIASWELSYKYNFIPLVWRKEVLGKLNTPQAQLMNKLEE